MSVTDEIIELLRDLAKRLDVGELQDNDTQLCNDAAKELWRLKPRKSPSQVVGTWKDGVFTPLSRYMHVVRNFEEGVEIAMEQVEERDMHHHAAFFARIKTMFESLPDEWSRMFKSEHHMRKYALLKTGFIDGSNNFFSHLKEAHAYMAFAEAVDKYLINDAPVKTDNGGWLVRTWTPRSQKRWDGKTGMKNEEFRRSCKEVEAFCVAVLGAEPADVNHQAQRYYKRGRT